MTRTTEILFVEDDPDLRDLVAAFLGAEGYEVETAGDGREALAVVERRMPRLLLLDLKMPVMDGKEFAARFHDRYDRIVPIVVVTASDDARGRAEEVGASGYVSKPFDLDALLAVVARHCASA